jgi:hypothetical protein
MYNVTFDTLVDKQRKANKKQKKLLKRQIHFFNAVHVNSVVAPTICTM